MKNTQEPSKQFHMLYFLGEVILRLFLKVTECQIITNNGSFPVSEFKLD